MGNRSTWEKFQVALGILKNPLMLLLDKSGLVKDPVYKTYETAQHSGMEFMTRAKTTDINDAVVVLSGKEYPPELIGFSKESETQQIVLDCGGHIGTFSMYIKSHRPNAQILALEPVPENLEMFQNNMERNRLTNVKVIPYALYGESGTFYIDLSNKQMDAVHITKIQPNHNSFIQVEAKTLDEILHDAGLNTIDLMKLDIEGAEYHVFKHSTSLLAAHVRRIIMEFHPAGNVAKRNEIVEALCKQNGAFELIYETRNILGFQNTRL